jgi:hypothetical protein
MNVSVSSDLANTHAASIERVEIIPLRLPLKSAVKISDGGARDFVDTLLVRLHTDTGLSGVGETQAWRRQGGSETHASLCSVIRDQFEPHLISASPFSIASIMHRLEQSIYHSLYAQAAISDALYDLQGKLLGVPVHRLLGGKCRDTLAACAILFIKPTVEDTIEGAREFYDRGFRSFTVKVGVDLRRDIETVAGLRERFGDDVIIRVDANAAMDFDSAALLLRKLERYDLDAAEQLLPDLGSHRIGRTCAAEPDAVDDRRVAGDRQRPYRRDPGAGGYRHPHQGRQERRHLGYAQALDHCRRRRASHLSRQSSVHQHCHRVGRASGCRLARAIARGRLRGRS